MKAKSKVNAATKANAAVAVAISATLKASLTAAISADLAKLKATTAAEQGIVLAGQAVKGAKFASREVAKLSIEPLFIATYAKAGKNEDYAKQQVSRVLTFAFLGLQVAKEPAKAKAVEANLQAAIATKKFGTNELQAIATGGKRYDEKKGQILALKTSRRAHNTLSPLATFTKAIDNAVTAFAKQKDAEEKILVAVAAAMVACKLIPPGATLSVED